MLQKLRHEINNSNRIYGLDLLRSIAILLVVYQHAHFILKVISPKFLDAKFTDVVDIFFVLSGFLIGGMLLQGMQSTKEINFSFVKKFLIRRWFRTLPNYYLFLLINIVLISSGLTYGYINKYLISFFVFAQNLFKPYDFLYWESWSLSVEEWLYLLFPLLLLSTSFLLKSNRKAAFLICLFLFILFSTIQRFVHADAELNSYADWDTWVRKLVIFRLDTFGFGLLGSWVYFYFPEIWKKSKWPCLLLGIVGYAVILNCDFFTHLYFMKTSYFTLSALSTLCFLPWAEQLKRNNSFFGKSITFISLISYPMYLINASVVGALILKNANYETHPVIYYIIYWVSIFILSTLVYIYYQKPITKLRDRF